MLILIDFNKDALADAVVHAANVIPYIMGGCGDKVYTSAHIIFSSYYLRGIRRRIWRRGCRALTSCCQRGGHGRACTRLSCRLSL